MSLLRKINNVNRKVNTANRTMRNMDITRNNVNRLTGANRRPQQQQVVNWSCLCGKVNQGAFCGECGQEPVYCSNDKCGVIIANPAKFCESCGTGTAWADNVNS